MLGTGLHSIGERPAELLLALAVAGAKLRIADREAPVLPLQQQGVAIFAELPVERAARLDRHVAFGRRRCKQGEPVAHRCVDALLEECGEKLFLAGEMPVQRALRISRFGGDLIDARLPVSAPRKDAQRRAQELLPSFAALRASSTGAAVNSMACLRSALPAAGGFARHV